MQCTRTITLSSVFLELLPFVNFYFGFLFAHFHLDSQAFLTDYPLMNLSCSGTSASLFFILIIPLGGGGAGKMVIVSVSPSC